MKTALRSACVAVLLLVTVLASPAEAKGPTDVRVSGPGIDTTLGFTQRGGDTDIGSLGEASRLYDSMGTLVLQSESPVDVDRLGPRYEITWLVGSIVILEQHAYPFAPGGAWVRFLPSDSGWGSGNPGWAEAPALEKELVAIGAVAESPEEVTAAEQAAAVTGPTSSEADTDEAGSPYDVALPVGFVLAGAAAIAGAVVLRRRRLNW